MGDLSYEGIEPGREYGPYEYPLKARIERHLEAIENGHPWHRERSPWGPPVAPPTLMANASLRFMDWIAPVPPGTLHAKQEAEFVSALRRDRRLIGYGKFVEKYEKRGRQWFVFEARWRDETGLILARTLTVMAFPTAATQAPEQGTGNKEQGKDELPRKGELTPVRRALTLARLTAYSEDSANALRGQSIHTDAAVAAAKGFPAAVAQGMMSAEYISEAMTGALGQGWLIGGRLSLAFVRPALCGDTLTANGRLAEEIDEGSYVRRVYEVWCENQRAEAVTVGTASGLLLASATGK
ncbi:MAG TPA: MaoC family dehydratase [Dehalococcoidia bacterium]|nr:MaoC family dehydratase [Dehalococcoidia bacterium]